METRQHRRISFAQNFLTSPKLVRRLVGMSTIGPSDTVCEIGPGNGIITAALATVAKQVIAIEKDPELVRRLRERFRSFDNVEIVENDFLDYRFGTRNGKIFANIPYNLTAQIVRKILSEPSNLSEGYLILQKEAARKFSGTPRETLFSILVKPHDLEFPLNATPTELSFEQWLDLYHGFKRTRSLR